MKIAAHKQQRRSAITQLKCAISQAIDEQYELTNLSTTEICSALSEEAFRWNQFLLKDEWDAAVKEKGEDDG